MSLAARITSPLAIIALAAIGGGIGGVAVSLPWPSVTEIAQCPWPNCSDHGKRRRTPYETTRRKSSCCIKTRDGVMCWSCADYDELSQDQIISQIKYGRDALKPDEMQ